MVARVGKVREDADGLELARGHLLASAGTLLQHHARNMRLLLTTHSFVVVEMKQFN